MLGFSLSNLDFPELNGKRVMTVECLIRVLGHEGAECLIYYWGGMRVSIPNVDDLHRVRLRERVIHAFNSGATSSQIAERFGISIRTAQRMRNPSTCVENGAKMI